MGSILGMVTTTGNVVTSLRTDVQSELSDVRTEILNTQTSQANNVQHTLNIQHKMDKDICDIRGNQLRIDQALDKLNQVKNRLEDKLDKHQASADIKLKHLEDGIKYLTEGLEAIHSLLLKHGDYGPSTSTSTNKRDPPPDDMPEEDSSTKGENRKGKDILKSGNAQSQGGHEP